MEEDAWPTVHAFITKNQKTTDLKEYDEEYSNKYKNLLKKNDDEGTCTLCGTKSIKLYDLTSDGKKHGHLMCLRCTHEFFINGKKIGFQVPQSADNVCPCYFDENYLEKCDKEIKSSDLHNIICDPIIIENYKVRTGEKYKWSKDEWNSKFDIFMKSLKDFNDPKYSTCATMCPYCLEWIYMNTEDFQCGYQVSHICGKKSNYMETEFSCFIKNKDEYCIICSRPSCNEFHRANKTPHDFIKASADCGKLREFLARIFAVKFKIDDITPEMTWENIQDECAKYSQLNFEIYLGVADDLLEKYPLFKKKCDIENRDEKYECHIPIPPQKTPSRTPQKTPSRTRKNQYDNRIPLKMKTIQITYPMTYPISKMTKPKPKPMSKRPWRGGSNKKTRKRRH